MLCSSGERYRAIMALLFLSYDPLNIENSYLSHIFMSALFRERLMHLPKISFLTELWHMLDVKCSGRVCCSACGTFILYCILLTVNFLKFRTLYSILFWLKFCFLCSSFFKYLVEWQTV